MVSVQNRNKIVYQLWVIIILLVCSDLDWTKAFVT